MRTVYLTKQIRSRQAGSIAVITVLILAGAAVVVMAMAAAAVTQLRMSRTGQDAAINLTLAEAGVDDSIDQLSRDRTVTSVSGTLYEDAAQTRPLGTYRTAISDVDVSLGQKKVVSTATGVNGSHRTVVALVTQGTLQLGRAALMSNGTISLGGGADIETTPSNQHVADVYANGNVTLGGSGSDDGRLIAAGTVTGTGYFPSVSNAPPYAFPTAYEQTQMQNTWTAMAASGQSYNASTLINGSKSVTTITAPATINGNLQIGSGQTLILQGDGVVYITGDLKLTGGASLINGSTLVVGGSYNQTGQSSYAINPQATPAPTLAVCTGDIGLQGGSGNLSVGVVYAVRGGVSVSGNAAFTGALVAGGAGSSISCTGTFNQYFPVNMASRISFPAAPVVTNVQEL